ncbi:MAG: acyl-CoA thioesterase [Haloarculaceae archaeon]
MPSVSDTYIENRHRVQPNHANNHGSVHGGNVMKWMDEVGAMSAMRAAGQPCVTANVDQLSFEAGVPTGDTVAIESYVFETGHTSLQVRLKAFREDPGTGERERTTESYFVFVAVDGDGRPTPVPDIDVDSERCRRLREAALDRRE